MRFGFRLYFWKVNTTFYFDYEYLYIDFLKKRIKRTPKYRKQFTFIKE